MVEEDDDKLLLWNKNKLENCKQNGEIVNVEEEDEVRRK